MTARSSTSKPKPWQRRQPRLQAPNTLVKGTPQATLAVYDDIVLLTRRSRGVVRSYPVDPHMLAVTLAKVPTVSGLLPPHTLGTGIVRSQSFIVVYVAPQQITVHLADERRCTFMTPPIIWAGMGADYRIFALATETYPNKVDTPLQHAPFPNCDEDGKICWGDVERRPTATSATLLDVLMLFLTGSRFNAHLSDGKSHRKTQSVLGLWPLLAPDAPYPLNDLVPNGRTLGWLLDGSAWGASH